MRGFGRSTRGPKSAERGSDGLLQVCSVIWAGSAVLNFWVAGGVDVDRPGRGCRLEDVVDVLHGCKCLSHGLTKPLDGALKGVESVVVALEECDDWRGVDHEWRRMQQGGGHRRRRLLMVRLHSDGTWQCGNVIRLAGFCCSCEAWYRSWNGWGLSLLGRWLGGG